MRLAANSRYLDGARVTAYGEITMSLPGVFHQLLHESWWQTVQPGGPPAHAEWQRVFWALYALEFYPDIRRGVRPCG